MTFQEWWDSEERDADYFLPVIAEAAWNAAAAAERDKHASLSQTVAALGINPEGGCDPDDVAALIAQLLAAERERCAAICKEEDTDCMFCNGTVDAERRIRVA